MRRQGAGQHRDPAQRPGIEQLAEAGQPLRQGHPVQPVLQVAVLAADMDLAAAVLHHAGGLGEQRVERLVAAARQGLDEAAVQGGLPDAEAVGDLLPERRGRRRLHQHLGQGGLGQVLCHGGQGEYQEEG